MLSAGSVLESLRHEIERCDVFAGLMLVSSTAGGTGSGLGSRLIERVRDEYGAACCIGSALVCPFQAGETPLQSYNSLLTLRYVHTCVLHDIYAFTYSKKK